MVSPLTQEMLRHGASARLPGAAASAARTAFSRVSNSAFLSLASSPHYASVGLHRQNNERSHGVPGTQVGAPVGAPTGAGAPTPLLLSSDFEVATRFAITMEGMHFLNWRTMETDS